MISEYKLDFWIKNNLNVLFIGKHGVGKTSIVKAAFERNKLRWKYFSASTMDPWVDFIGVPKEQKDDKGLPYLDLVRPKTFRDDEVDALFFDEYNRANKKVKNAVMELIQFKSINGFRFNNLKIVWAAINPDDDDEEEYDVEKMDAAQKDRFHIHITIPFLPEEGYFSNKFGKFIAETAINWWKELPEKTKNLVSPRRLDYTLEIWKTKGDIRDVLPSGANISQLLNALDGKIDYQQLVKEVVAHNDIEKAQELIKNSVNEITPFVLKHTRYIYFFMPYYPPEILKSLVQSNLKVANWAQNNPSLTKTDSSKLTIKIVDEAIKFISPYEKYNITLAPNNIATLYPPPDNSTQKRKRGRPRKVTPSP